MSKRSISEELEHSNKKSKIDLKKDSDSVEVVSDSDIGSQTNISDEKEQKQNMWKLFDDENKGNIQDKSLAIIHKGETLYSNVIGVDMDTGWGCITPDTPEEVLGLFTTGVDGCTVVILSSPDNRYIYLCLMIQKLVMMK